MQNIQQLQQKIEGYWAEHTNKTLKIDAEFEETVNEVLSMLNSGELRVSNKPSEPNGEWTTNQWIKEAILLYFKLPNQFNITPHVANNSQAHHTYYDKVPLKFSNWEEEEYEKSQIRVVAGTTVRNGTHIAKNSVIMTSFINTGVFIDEETMIDTLAAIGSCAQIGKRCHISAGAMIGGVLEPIQANPVIIEDNCFIGLNSGIAEGVIVREGSVISMGVNIGASTKILNRQTGEVTYGEIPPRSVVVAGSIPSGGANIACAVIVKQVDDQTSAKTELNNILRTL